MAIDFKTALTISGVTVQPGYPALAGLTAGQVLRASNGTTDDLQLRHPPTTGGYEARRKIGGERSPVVRRLP